jgi:hypothetical protein
LAHTIVVGRIWRMQIATLPMSKGYGGREVRTAVAVKTSTGGLVAHDKAECTGARFGRMPGAI